MSASVSLLGSCVTTAPQTMATVHIEVDVYSGRPNPTWELTHADAERFRALVAALPRRSGSGPASSEGLGYRGLRVTVTADGAIERFSIAKGVVTVESAAVADQPTLRDPDRALEKWLLRTGRDQLGADLLEHLLASQ